MRDGTWRDGPAQVQPAATNNRLPVLAVGYLPRSCWSARGGAGRNGIRHRGGTRAYRGEVPAEARAMAAWLRQNCKLPERTAQLYMHIAELVDVHGLKSATVADLGVRFLGKMKQAGIIRSPGYNPFFHCDEEGKRQWLLFMLFGAHPEHVEWVLQKQFRTPDEWLGEEGTRWRRQCRFAKPEIGASFLKDWAKFQQQHAADSMEEVEAALQRFHVTPEAKQWVEDYQGWRAARARRLKRSDSTPG